MNSIPPFRLTLFASPRITTGEGEMVSGRAAQRHRLALLAMLALATRQGISRDKLIGYLWPERHTDAARQLLNQAVYNLRKALGEEALLSEGDDLRLNTELIRPDVAEFEAALARGDHLGAVQLYAGVFLDGFFLGDSPEFEEWVERERQRLAASHAKALESLADSAQAEGDLHRAVEWWKERAALDPYDSRVALRLATALDASGNPGGAMQSLRVHQHLLADGFGVEPSAEMLALAEQLRRKSDASAARNAECIANEVSHQPVGGAENVEEPAPPRAADVLPASPSGGNSVAAITGRRLRSRPIAAVRYGLAAFMAGAVLVSGIRLAAGRAETAKIPDPEISIAVLPLANHSAEPGEAALGEGMTEELIAMLAKAGLRVIASTSVSMFRNSQMDVRSIADSLKVSHVLEGGVQKSGSRLRVHVRLVAGSDGATRWSETYDRDLQDVFAVQDDIARAVTRELGIRLGGVTGEPLRRHPTQSIAAYELYLRGSDPAVLRSDSTAREATEFFRQAIALDPTYAAAYAGLARMSVRVAAAREHRDAPSKEWLARAEEAALTAVALDGSLAKAHGAIGVVRESGYDFESAETHYKHSIALDPTWAFPREWLAGLYIRTGRFAEALAEAEGARAIDPLSPSANAELARALLVNGRCDEALTLLEPLAALQPPLLRVASIAAQCYTQKQMWREAIAVLRPQAERGERQALAHLAFVLARAGQDEEALRIHANLLDQWQRGTGGALEVALVYAGLRDLDQAFGWLERAADDSSSMPSHRYSLVMEPVFEDLRRDPRFDPLRDWFGNQKR
jgi:adenylate cyclase